MTDAKKNRYKIMNNINYYFSNMYVIRTILKIVKK